MGLFNKTPKEVIVYAPVSGTLRELKKVKDEVFSSGMVGNGIAIVPDNKSIMSPVDAGTVVTAFHTGHAFGIKTKQGPELLIHVGLDTVNMKGEGFKSFVKAEEKITKNSKIVDADFTLIKKKAKGVDTLILATNDSMEGFKIEFTKNSGKVKLGEEIFRIIKK